MVSRGLHCKASSSSSSGPRHGFGEASLGPKGVTAERGRCEPALPPFPPRDLPPFSAPLPSLLPRGPQLVLLLLRLRVPPREPSPGEAGVARGPNAGEETRDKLSDKELCLPGVPGRHTPPPGMRNTAPSSSTSTASPSSCSTDVNGPTSALAPVELPSDLAAAAAAVRQPPVRLPCSLGVASEPSAPRRLRGLLVGIGVRMVTPCWVWEWSSAVRGLERREEALERITIGLVRRGGPSVSCHGRIPPQVNARRHGTVEGWRHALSPGECTL